MAHQNFLLDPSSAIVIDTSVVININASGYAQEILKALPYQIFVLNEVLIELEQGKKNGCRDADLLKDYQKAGLVEIKQLNEIEIELFEQLVIGPAGTTLDDGESATIAYAVRNGLKAIIDERKAHRICQKQYPSLCVGNSVDLFSHPNVIAQLKEQEVRDSIINALQGARMRVFQEHMEWITQLIGTENVSKYNSLPRSARQNSGIAQNRS